LKLADQANIQRRSLLTIVRHVSAIAKRNVRRGVRRQAEQQGYKYETQEKALVYLYHRELKFSKGNRGGRFCQSEDCHFSCMNATT